MTILVISQYFPPEPGAPSNRIKAFVEAMVERGHQVTVICQFPNYPTGILDKNDEWRLFRFEKKEDFTILRCFVLAFRKKNNIKRMLYYLSFAVSSFVAALWLRRRDVIFASSPPIFFVFGAMLAARLKRSRFVADIRDLWPDSAKEVEAVGSPRLLRWGGRLEKSIYEQADRLFTISAGLKKIIENRGGMGKTDVIYNGSVEDFVNWKKDIPKLRKKFGWQDRLVITYAGIIGLGQDLLSLLPELPKLKSRGILFNFIGDGPQKEILQAEISRVGLTNVEFHDHMPMEQAIDYICCSDIMLVILRECELFRSAIPSKFFDGMAAGLPIVTNVDGELRELLETNNAGIYFSLKQKGAFADAIMRLAADGELRNSMGKNGRRLVETSFLRKHQARKAVEMIESMVQQSASSRRPKRNAP